MEALNGILNSSAVKYASLSMALLASVIAFFSNVGGVWSLLKEVMLNEEPLVAIQGRLTPVFRHPGLTSNQDDVALSIQVRNYSESPVTLISASLSTQGARTLAVAKSGARGGGCTLGPDRNDNNPLVIAPGGTQWLTLGDNVELSGVSKFLTDERLSEVFIHKLSGMPFSIAQLGYVDQLNDFFEKSYGADSNIKVTLNSISGSEHILSFPLARGKDLFAKDGSLHHDWFIASWKNWRDMRSLGGYNCELKPES